MKAPRLVMLTSRTAGQEVAISNSPLGGWEKQGQIDQIPEDCDGLLNLVETPPELRSLPTPHWVADLGIPQRDL